MSTTRMLMRTPPRAARWPACIALCLSIALPSTLFAQTPPDTDPDGDARARTARQRGMDDSGTYNEDTIFVTATRPEAGGPLPGLRLEHNDIPANVQSADADDLRKSHAINIADFLSSQFQSINVNDYQGNPFQMDVTFRGFSASPQLGTPQGLSVFFDGVRVNEPFGDVVNWDLIPLNALRRVDLYPGSNPVFGLNTLGGALSLTTKSGFTDAGADAQITAGSWGRNEESVSGGTSAGPFAVFGAFTRFHEDGWRDHSPSDVRQLYGKLEFRSDRLLLGLSGLFADNDLVGNGLIPQELFDKRAASVFTSPDITRNKLRQFVFTGAFDVDDVFSITGNAYLRRSDRKSVASDIYEPFQEMRGDANAGPVGSTTPVQADPPLCRYQDANGDKLIDYGFDYDGDGAIDPGTLNTPYINDPGAAGFNADYLVELPPINDPDRQYLCTPDQPPPAGVYRQRNGAADGGPGVVEGTPVAEVDTSRIGQTTRGAALQFNWNTERHKFMVGLAYDRSSDDYFATSQLGLLDDSHNVYLAPEKIDRTYYAAQHPVTVNAFDGASTTQSVYFSETWSPREDLRFNASARYNDNRVGNRLRVRSASSYTDLHQLHDFTQVFTQILCPSGDLASCPDMPNVSGYGDHVYYKQLAVPPLLPLTDNAKTERYSFESFNPSLGASWDVRPDVNVFANWSAGARAPSVIELGCAFDASPLPSFGGTPNYASFSAPPCNLPSALSGDPYLPQIRSRSVEIGARGEFGGQYAWNASAYQTDLRDDIMFVSINQARGYFDTIDRTRRRGLELGLTHEGPRLDFKAGYSYTRATYESVFFQQSQYNSSADFDINGGHVPGIYPLVLQPDGSFTNTVPYIDPAVPSHRNNRGYSTFRQIRIDPGARMAGVPLHNFNADVTLHLTPRWDLGLGMVAHSSSFVRGNENNRHRAAGTDKVTPFLYCDILFPDDGSDPTQVECVSTASPFDRPGRPFVHNGYVPGYAVFNLDSSYDFGHGVSVFLKVTNLFDRKFYTAGRLGVNPFVPSVEGTIGPGGFDYNSHDWQPTTFVSPAAPRGIFIGASYRF